MKEIKANVQGMTCSSCEVLIERNIRKLPGVHKVHVSRAKEELRVKCDDTVNLNTLQEAIAEKGYTLLEQEGSSGASFILKDKDRYAEIGSVIVVLIGIYFMLTQFELIPDNFGVTENMSYGFIFLLGLVAATSTCLAVAGGLLLAVAGKFQEKYPHLTGIQKFKPHISFNVGRIVSYTLFGGLIGLVGSALTLSPKITGVITIIASIMMIIMGLQLLQLFPWMNRIQFKMPKFLAHRLYDASTEQGPNTRNSFLFGAATFFLPCGFTQALQLYVLGTGSFLTGALTMLAFSLGTLPALAGIGAFSSFAKGTVQRYFLTFSAVLVIVLGIFNIPNGLALTGTSIGPSAGIQLPDGVGIPLQNGQQVIEMTVNGLNYEPASFTLQQGVPVEWRIDGRKATGCAQVISVPDLGITEYLPRDSIKTITFTPTQTGQIMFSCSMGMAGPGVFTVVAGEERGDKLAGSADEPRNLLPDTSETQRISMEISNERGFYPNTFTVKKGIPVEMEIDAKVQLGGCMGTMVIPEYNLAHRLSLGKTVIKFTPTKTGTFPFTCSMGSHLGDFIVV